MAKQTVYQVPRAVPMAKNICEMTPKEIKEFLALAKREKLLRLKRKWKEEAREAGVEFGSVMFVKE